MNAIEGIVHNGAAAPGDTVTVKLPDEQRALKVEGWTEQVGPVYPQQGDTALVIESDRGRLWLLSWITE